MDKKVKVLYYYYLNRHPNKLPNEFHLNIMKDQTALDAFLELTSGDVGHTIKRIVNAVCETTNKSANKKPKPKRLKTKRKSKKAIKILNKLLSPV